MQIEITNQRRTTDTMLIKDQFDVGDILEWEDKSSDIPALSQSDCVITGKTLNKKKIILHVKRQSDGSEGNVFVKLKDEFQSDFATSRKLLGSTKIVGMSIGAFKKLSIDEL